MAKYKKRKDGRYGTTVTAGYDPDTGKPIKIQVYGKSIRELEENKSIALARVVSNTFVAKDTTTLPEYARNYVGLYKDKRSINTQAMYKNLIDKYLTTLPLPMQKITAGDIQRLINDRWEHPRTCQQLKMFLRQLFRQSAADGMIVKNPMDSAIDYPPYKPKSKPPFTDTDIKAILTADLPDMERIFIMILLYTGVRRGEALALTKDDVDLIDKKIRINKSVVFDGNNPIIKDSPKSHAGNREIPIVDALYVALRGYIVSLDTFYLFTYKNDSGATSVLSKSAYTKFWGRIQAAMPTVTGSVTAHRFRKHFGTTLFYAGVDLKAAITVFGHADVKLLLTIYTSYDEDKSAISHKLNTYLSSQQKGDYFDSQADSQSA